MRALILWLASIWLTSIVAAPAADAKPTPWIVGAFEARRALAAGALLIDARPAYLKKKGPAVNNAIDASWKTLATGRAPDGGRLRPTPWLKKKLRALGVSPGLVLVAGDPRRGWGEAGWVVWLLRALGHRQAALVDGGIAALIRAGVRQVSPPKLPGNFRPSIVARLIARRSEVKSRIKDGKTVLLDSREAREYRGKTPYGERRGGHLPGARHLYFQRLIAPSGALRSPKAIIAELKRLGITRKTPVVAYCTGGVRSAFLVVVLRHLGFTLARNYPGSAWEWSAGAKEAYPLER